MTIYERLLPRITQQHNHQLGTPCWVCSGWSTGNGYAKVRDKGKCRVAHRALYEEVYGAEIPKRIVLDHRCRNRACVNPEHMDPVTHKVNTERGEAVLFRKKEYVH